MLLKWASCEECIGSDRMSADKVLAMSCLFNQQSQMHTTILKTNNQQRKTQTVSIISLLYRFHGLTQKVYARIWCIDFLDIAAETNFHYALYFCVSKMSMYVYLYSHLQVLVHVYELYSNIYFQKCLMRSYLDDYSLHIKSMTTMLAKNQSSMRSHPFVQTDHQIQAIQLL